MEDSHRTRTQSTASSKFSHTKTEENQYKKMISKKERK